MEEEEEGGANMLSLSHTPPLHSTPRIVPPSSSPRHLNINENDIKARQICTAKEDLFALSPFFRIKLALSSPPPSSLHSLPVLS